MRSLGLSLLILLLLPAVAFGHAQLAAVDPEGARWEQAVPTELRLDFTAPVEAAGLAVSVQAPDGTELVSAFSRVEGDPFAVVATLRPAAAVGTYRVQWRALSRDGHVSQGVVRPVHGGEIEAEPGVDHGSGPMEVVGRFLSLFGPLLVLGLVVVRIGVVVRSVDPATHRRWWMFWVGSLSAWAIGLALTVVAALTAFDRDSFGGFATAGDPSLGELLVDTRWGVAWLFQLGALVASYLLELAARRSNPGEWPERPWLWLLGVPAALALGAISWSGHAASGADATLNMALDAAHIWATALWIGGLVGLFVLVVLPARNLGDAARVGQLAAPVIRFSALAMTAVAVLVATGVYRGLAEVGGVADLVETDYGVALLIKLGLFAILLVLGAINRFVIHPRIERAQMGLERDDRGAGRALVSTVRMELVVSFALLVAVAFMVSLPPPA